MAGQNLTPDQIAAAAAVQHGAASQQQAAQNPQATPAAAQQQVAPGNPAQPPAQNPPTAEFILTQDQFNQRWAEKMAALEKEIGMPITEVKALAEKSKKPPAPSQSADPISGAELRLAKMEALMLAGVPSKKIPGLLSRVQGKSKADIEADIQQMIAEGFLVIEDPKPAAQPPQPQPAPQPLNQAQGAGNLGVPPGPKVWTRAELAKLPPEEYEKHRLEIHAALRDGRVK